ncbi:MAG TPA: hypothetical protein VFU05_03565 [Cyclobacteriaceae bacterium]|nr:hypothetical protein [Cyclobacteriaceae bacterium]
MSKQFKSTHFAPELHIPNHTFNIDFYLKFGAQEHFCFKNDDGRWRKMNADHSNIVTRHTLILANQFLN